MQCCANKFGGNGFDPSMHSSLQSDLAPIVYYDSSPQTTKPVTIPNIPLCIKRALLIPKHPSPPNPSPHSSSCVFPYTSKNASQFLAPRNLPKPFSFLCQYTRSSPNQGRYQTGREGPNCSAQYLRSENAENAMVEIS